MKGKVIKVLDGDTFTLDYHGIPLRCRIANIDAPEKSKAFGKESKTYLENLILDKTIDFQYIEKGTYNRCVVIPFTENHEPIDEILVKKGMAWHWTKFSHKPKLEALEEKARKQKIGLWQDNIINLHFSERTKKLANITSNQEV